MKTKYIVTEQGGIFIFDCINVHQEVARSVGGKVISAGFIGFNGKNFYCYGKSLSLGLYSRPKEDSILANNLFEIENP